MRSAATPARIVAVAAVNTGNVALRRIRFRAETA
jgi:hypothetical protein